MADITNINGINIKDAALREGIDTLRSSVVARVIKPLTVTENGTYTADPTAGTYGYSPVVVDVQEQPWEPLEDGYSNFWFELTDDTLSPWLNFSAKNNDAVIDWGDGSGEVALDTLTPTHTYAKAGKYVVKVKGVTGVNVQEGTTSETRGKYLSVLTAVELNTEVTSMAESAFYHMFGLKRAVFNGAVNKISRSCFHYATALESFTIPNTVTNIDRYGFYMACTLKAITIPTNVTTINTYAFQNCVSLGEIHVLSATPFTLNSGVFSGLPDDFIIYVPVGTSETYKAASGWSTYADHILEEGQEP